MKQLYKWLRECSDRTMRQWTQDRANKLALAFGNLRWQSECFLSSPHHLLLVTTHTT